MKRSSAQSGLIKVHFCILPDEEIAFRLVVIEICFGKLREAHSARDTIIIIFDRPLFLELYELTLSLSFPLLQYVKVVNRETMALSDVITFD